MTLNRHSFLVLALIIPALFIGCSDDDPVSPEEPRIESVVISPDSVTLETLGETVQFEAVAYDQYGAMVDTSFTWESSDSAVVIVNSMGAALSTGIGTASVVVMTAGLTDTAQVTVSPGGANVIEWIAGGDGDWENGANWSGGVAPGGNDIAAIRAAGTYTVSLNGDVTVLGLVLGNESGTQTLATQRNTLNLGSGAMAVGGVLAVEGELLLGDEFAWSGGLITGAGTVAVGSGAELDAVGDPLDLDVRLNNLGALILWNGSSLRVNRVLESSFGGLIELRGDATLTVQNDGSLVNSGTIRKSEGEGEAAILAGTAEFLSMSGSALMVDSGSLWISGGSLRGLVEIDGDAMLRQSSNTEILSLNSRGDGPFVIGGTATIGNDPSQIINVRNLILDSSSLTAITGPASLLIDNSFVWRRGTVHNLKSLNTQIGSLTTFETTGTKSLSGTRWSVIGTVAGDSNVNLELANDGIIRVEFAGRWLQAGGGTITEGLNGADGFDVVGEFHKTGEGAFVVETPVTCSGTLALMDGALTVQGDFSLLEGGLITGGGTGDLGFNTRLILIDAPTAVVLGTIRPDLDGEPARMGIQGVIDMEPSCRIELDVSTSGIFNTENLEFQTSGQEYGGTLALTFLSPVDPGVDYRLISAFVAQGEFDTITSDQEQFDEIVYDQQGVVGRQFASP